MPKYDESFDIKSRAKYRAKSNYENMISERGKLEKKYGVEYNKKTNPYMYSDKSDIVKEYNKYFEKKNKETY